MAIQEIIDQLEKLSVLDLVELKKALEERWGVTAAAPMMMGGMMPAGGQADGGAPAVVEEPTEFNVILTEIGAEKIKVIKAVRELTALGLKEAKEVVDGAPRAVKEGVNKDEAAKIKQVMEEAGAKVEIKPV